MSSFNYFTVFGFPGWKRWFANGDCVGSYQVLACWCFSEHSHHEWSLEYRHLAGDLVSGVPGESTLPESGCDYLG